MDISQDHSPGTLVVLGIPFHNVSFSEAVAWARDRIRSRSPGYIATANMDFVMQAWRDPELYRILAEADLVVADGIPIVWLSGLMGPRLKGRVTGSDLVPMFAEMARDNGFSLYHLGGASGVPERAAEFLMKRFPGLRVAGCYSPPKAAIPDMNHAEILTRLETANPDLLLVAFGGPKQEKWVDMHIRNWRIPLAMGVGGSLDVLAGAQKRAPRIVQRLALEWLWRMCSDPRRLVSRYVGNLWFFWRVLLALVVLRCRRDQVFPELGVDSVLRGLAHVQSFRRLRDEAQAQAFCSGVLAESGGRPVVVDLGGLSWLSSLDQGVLLRLTTALRRQGRRCILVNAGRRVRLLLEWCHLSDYLELAGSVDAVAAAMPADR